MAECLPRQGPGDLSPATTTNLSCDPYVVAPQHAPAARQALSPDAVRAPEQAAKFDAGRQGGREWARVATRQELTRVCGYVFSAG